jgi:DNA processing protein
MPTELQYQIALTLVPYVGNVHAKILVDHFGNAGAIFQSRKSFLEKIDGIGSVRAKHIRSFANFARAEQEAEFIAKYKILPLFLTDTKYPKRLLNCYDCPTLLYYKGNADLNHPRIVALVGSRTHTEYGKQITENLIRDLGALDVMVVSGLAFGIDAVAHRAALKNNLATVGVLAHGLNKLYPPEHLSLAREMTTNGGLLSEFRSHTKPDKHHFPIRNRIVAGMCDATIVIETGIRGGSMITAELANGYNRDVFAFPGKTTDAKSSGCNDLIKNNKAILLTDAEQLIDTMGWQTKTSSRITKQKSLFVTLTDVEKKIVDLLQQSSNMHIDELNLAMNVHNSALAAALLNLELQGVIASLPGKMISLT